MDVLVLGQHVLDKHEQSREPGQRSCPAPCPISVGMSRMNHPWQDGSGQQGGRPSQRQLRQFGLAAMVLLPWRGLALERTRHGNVARGVGRRRWRLRPVGFVYPKGLRLPYLALFHPGDADGVSSFTRSCWPCSTSACSCPLGWPSGLREGILCSKGGLTPRRPAIGSPRGSRPTPRVIFDAGNEVQKMSSKTDFERAAEADPKASCASRCGFSRIK